MAKDRKTAQTDDEAEQRHGRQGNQRVKPYMVLRILWRETDENHVMKALHIAAELNRYGVSAERRSVYKDIEEINRVAVAMENDCTVEEAAEMLERGEESRLIQYSASQKGFYLSQRNFDLDDMRLLAECVYSARFVSEAQAKRLVNVICEFVSEKQAEQIKHNALLTDRVRTDNASVLVNIATIGEAMSTENHTPEKIRFKYLQYTINNMKTQVERRHGGVYVVSPYRLLINDSNYYLLAYDDKAQEMRTYRVDRMRAVSPTGEPREGREVFDAIDLKTYTRRVFSMHSGEQTRVVIRCINPLLDSMVDKFGARDGAIYRPDDNRHFTVTAQVEVSDQFFGWLLGFGNRAKIIAPDNVVADFCAYMDKTRSIYDAPIHIIDSKSKRK